MCHGIYPGGEMFHIINEKNEILQFSFNSYDEAKEFMLFNNIDGTIKNEDELKEFIKFWTREKELHLKKRKRFEQMSKGWLVFPESGWQNYYYKTFSPKNESRGIYRPATARFKVQKGIWWD